MKRITTEEWVKIAIEKHGDKYDYSKVNYIGSKTPVTIRCKKHDAWYEQIPSVHINGVGCPICAQESRVKTKKDKIIRFNDAKELVSNMGIKSQIEYFDRFNDELSKLRLPKYPQLAYKNEGWKSWPDFLNNGNRCISTEFMSYNEAEAFVHTLDLKSGKEWIEYTKSGSCPKNIPHCPMNVYAGNGWKSMGEWLGTGSINHADMVFYTYKEAKTEIQKLSLNGIEDFIAFSKTEDFPKMMPKQPQHKYESEWEGWNKFLGYDRKIRKIEGSKEFIELAKKIHGDKYDYSKVEYENIKKRVCIICPEHGEFWQTPDVHLKGCGCPVCNQGFTREYKLSLLKMEDLAYMTSHQLIEVIANKKLPQEFKSLALTHERSEERLGSIQDLIDLYSNDELSAEEADMEAEAMAEEQEREFEARSEEEGNGSEFVEFSAHIGSDSDIENNHTEDSESSHNEPSLPTLVVQGVHAHDNIEHLKPSDDAAKFILNEELHRKWNEILKANEEGILGECIDAIKNEEGGEFWNFVKETFLNEFNEVMSIEKDDEYRFEYEPSLMQKLMVYYLKNNKSFGNWCGTGAGKTNAFLFATRKTNSRVTVAIVPNDVIDTLKNSINAIYPNSNVVVPQSAGELHHFDEDKFTYVIYNYEKFQGNNGAEETVNRLLETNKIDFVCLDEVQNVKVRDTDNASSRSQFINNLVARGREINPEMRTLVMSATPCINNLQEVRSIIELLTGKQHEEIGNRNTIANIHAAYKALLINGFRYVPKYNIEIIERPIEIDRTNDEQLYNVLINQDKGDIPNIEYILALRKLDSVKNEIKAGTIVYATWVSGMAEMLVDNIKSWGYTAESYNGESGNKDGRKEVLDRFLKGKTDVLVCSKPISTGVDGLQKHCNKMIVISLPWTDADYTQLKGRIYRQGSVFDKVEFVIPQIIINTPNGTEWSWDKMRKHAIDTKKSLGTAVVDGKIQESYTINKIRLLTKAIEALENGLEDAVVVRKPVDSSVSYTPTERQYSESYINDVHRLANSSNSRTTHERYQNNRSEFEEYHRQREIAKTDWIEDPVDRVAEIIKGMSSRYTRVADMGCGMNKLKNVVDDTRTVQGIDHINVSGDDTVIEADMSNLNGVIEDNSIDVAVFCLSLWGTNYREYFTEAHRILDSDGKVIIVEPSSKFGEHERYNTIDNFVDDIESYGFERIGKVETRNNFVYIKFQKI